MKYSVIYRSNTRPSTLDVWTLGASLEEARRDAETLRGRDATVPPTGEQDIVETQVRAMDGRGTVVEHMVRATESAPWQSLQPDPGPPRC